jgi:dihydropteroate synthase
VSATEEEERVVAAVAAIRAITTLPISIDTMHARVAESAFRAGADVLNDVTGLRGDMAMAAAAAQRGVPVIAMHNQRGRPFHDVVDDIRAGFAASMELADAVGIPDARLILDPGFGFGWTPQQNLEMLRRLPELWELRLPLLVGVSRKSTLGLVTGAPVDARLPASAAAVALTIAGGADIVRVHDVVAMRDVVRMADAVVRGNWRQG